MMATESMRIGWLEKIKEQSEYAFTHTTKQNKSAKYMCKGHE